MNSALRNQDKSFKLAMNEVSFQSWNLRFLAVAFLVLAVISSGAWSSAFIIASISMLSFSFFKQGWAIGLTGSALLWLWLFRYIS